MKTKVFNLVILDESGSMESIKASAISNVNETFQTIRNAQTNHEDQEHFVTFVTFDSEAINTIYDCAPVSTIHEINDNIYRPNACTPLYDAMGFSITNLRSKVSESDKILVTIVTDGLENASKEYNGRAIKKLVEEMKENGWVFVYMGANHDVESFAEHISINNYRRFEATDAGVYACLSAERDARTRYYDRISDAKSSPADINEDFDFFKEY